MSQDSTENIEKENINEEIVSENQEILTPELSVEEQLQLDLTNEKDKFLRLFAEFENYKTKEERDRGYDQYDLESTKKDRKIEIRMVFSNKDLEDAIKERAKNRK